MNAAYGVLVLQVLARLQQCELASGSLELVFAPCFEVNTCILRLVGDRQSPNLGAHHVSLFEQTQPAGGLLEFRQVGLR